MEAEEANRRKPIDAPHVVPALEAKNLSCHRSGRCVFRNLSFALRPGIALVAVGANGSGKSSLLRVLAGLLPLSHGHLLWQGESLDTGSEDWRKLIRYVGHLDACKPEETIGETLSYWSRLCGAPLIEDPFGVLRDGGSNQRVRALSAGQRRKLALTRLCMEEQGSGLRVWLLDEPTTALDRKGQEIFVNLVERHLKASGIAVMASHQRIPLARSETLALEE